MVIIHKQNWMSFAASFSKALKRASWQISMSRLRGLVRLSWSTYQIVIEERLLSHQNPSPKRDALPISGHAKASFIPDNDLKDLINSPFAHFQTVAINDEANLEEMASIANDDILEMAQALETEETDGGQNPLNESSDEEMPEKEDLALKG